MAGKNHNRGLVLMGAAVTDGITGAIYMWSVFNKPLIAQYGWGAVEVSLAYSLYLLTVCIGGFFVGALQRRFQPKYLVFIGGVLMGLGYLFTGFVTTIPMLYLTFSLIGGLGNSFIYNTAVSTTIKWFPDKRGFANGICIGCMGLAPLAFAPLANFLIEAFDAASAFKILGIGLIVAYSIFSWFLAVPDPDWKPEGWNPEASSKVAASTESYTMGEMIKTPLFWLMWLIFACAATGGMMMTGQASGIGQSLASMTAAQGALMVGILAVGNFIGRFVFGSISDKVGRFQTLIICTVVTCIAMIAFPVIANTFISFMVMIVIVGACFGGVMCIMPSLTGDAFGAANVGQNYAAVYSGYTVASFIGPTVASACVANAGNYSVAFVVAAVFSACAVVLMIVAWRIYTGMTKENA